MKCRITEQVRDTLVDSSDSVEDEDRAEAFLLGSDRDGVIDTVEKLHATGGCHTLPYVHSASISTAMISIIKKDRSPTGIARTGKFKAKGSKRHHMMENGITRLLKTSNDMLFVSVGIDGIIAELCHKKASDNILLDIEILRR